MKILQVIPYFPPAYAFGGSPQVAYQMCRELAKRGHDVTVYTSDAKDFTSRLSVKPADVVDGVKVCYFKNAPMKFVNLSRLFVTPKMLSKARDEIRTFDVVHLHEYRTFQNAVVHHFAKKFDVPYVLQAHGSLPRIAAKQKLKWIYDLFFGYKLLRNASKVIAVSSMEALQCRRIGVPEVKIAVLPNGIDLSEYADLPLSGTFRKKFGIDEDEKIALYLGRIHKIKGLDILARAFSKVVRELDGVKLVAAGPDDGYLRDLESLIRVLKIEGSVLIPGPLYGRDKFEAYVDADLFVLPSRYDIWGMSALEAIACGTPVIVTENCGIADYIGDEVGLIVKAEPNHMAEALLGLLENPHERNSLRMKCHRAREDMSISKMVSKLEKVYEEIQ